MDTDVIRRGICTSIRTRTGKVSKESEQSERLPLISIEFNSHAIFYAAVAQLTTAFPQDFFVRCLNQER